MNPRIRIQHRMNVVLQMVLILITAILLGQLWLFTVTLEAMENHSISTGVVIATTVCSLAACGAIWTLIRYFLRTERTEGGQL